MRDETYDIIYETELDHWWYRVRRKIVGNIVRPYAKERGKPLRILDVGCGMGALMSEMQHYGEVAGIDISDRALRYCKERGLSNVMLGDATHLPFPDASFDVIVILDVLEHIDDDSAGAREISRVLAPGGMAIVAVPAFMFLWGITDEVSHHFRRYRLKEIRTLIANSGLNIQRSTYFNTFLFPAIAAVRLAVRFFRIPMKTENTIGGGFADRVLYAIFSLEAAALKYASFPFGVSALIVARK